MPLRLMPRLRRAIAVALLLPVLAFCLPRPASASFFGGVTIKDEKEMGQRFDILVRASMPVIQDPEVTQYIRALLHRLTRSITHQPYTFVATVILNNSLNAFAIPGGYVYVFTGLIMNLEDEESLAAVLCHELAHVTQRHVAARMERAKYLTIGSLLLAIAGVAAGGSGGGAIAMGALGAGQSAMLSYSRQDENEADNIGFQYLLAAGYPPQGMADGFKVLRQKSWMSGTSVPTYLSTHPAIGDRINNIMARVAALPLSVQNRTQDEKRFNRVQALLWARYGDEQSALQRFSSRSDALSVMGRGVVLSRMNRVKDAEAAFDKAVAMAPGDALVNREAGIFHFRKGDMPSAEKLLREAMRLDPRDYMATFFYARYLDESGKTTQAENYYKEVLRYVPEEADVHEAYARCLGKANRTLDAYIHMTYSALYANNKRLMNQYLAKAKALAEKSSDKKEFQRLEAACKVRKEIWDKD